MNRILFIIIPVLFLLVSCKPLERIIEVPIETIETVHIHDIRIDTIIEKDSVDRYIKGDTVFVFKEHTKYVSSNKIDTIIKVDSIPKVVKVEVVKEVEVNHIKWYQKTLMWIGGIVSLVLSGYVIYKLKFK